MLKSPTFLNRALWLKLHLYIALLAGFFFALLGLTGSLSIYRAELDTWFNPQLIVSEHSGQPQSLDKIFAAVKAAHPQRYGSWTLEMPLTASGMITAWFDKPQETLFEFHAPLMVSVNPYTAEVVDSRFWGQTLMTWLLDWHTQLHADDLGWQLVGYLGALLFISATSGLYLWWTSLKSFVAQSAGSEGNNLTVWRHPVLLRLRQFFIAFRIRPQKGWQVLSYDWHRLTGSVFAVSIVLLALSGMALSFSPLLEKLVGTEGMAHGETGKAIVSHGDVNNHPTTLAGAVFIARSAFPDAELRRISTPLGESGVYRINFRLPAEVNRRHPFTTVWIDQWNGQIKAIRNPESFSRGEKLLTWLWPLHTGEALGSTGRLLWFLAGLALVGLYISGLLLWLFRQGWLKDRAVDFGALKAFFVQAGQYGVMGTRLSVRFLQRQILPVVKPFLRQIKLTSFWANSAPYMQALQRLLQRMWTYCRQKFPPKPKRLEHKD